MPGYVNASQVGNILYLDTKCCIQEDATYKLIIVKFEKKFKKYFRSYCWKIFYKSNCIWKNINNIKNINNNNFFVCLAMK